MLRTRAATRLLDERDLPALRRLLADDPVANVFVASRVHNAGLNPHRLGAEVWGHVSDGDLAAACYSGANLIPAGTGADCAAAVAVAARAFAERGRRQGRRCSSIVGAADLVLPLWELLAPTWGRPRELRPDQPLLAIDRPPLVSADPGVRPVRLEEVDVVLPACIAMFTEEVGVSPIASDGGALYRARVYELVAAGRAFARIEDGRVLFKAEIGAATRQASQIQGVWVDPALRGRGLGTAGTAAVVALTRERIAPVVSLYVNAFNVPARRAYERVGFTQVGTFASVLF